MRQEECKHHQAVCWPLGSVEQAAAQHAERRRPSHGSPCAAASNSVNRRSRATAVVCRSRPGLAVKELRPETLVGGAAPALQSPARVERPCLVFVGPAALPPSAPCSRSSWRRRRQRTTLAVWASGAPESVLLSSLQQRSAACSCCKAATNHPPTHISPSPQQRECRRGGSRQLCRRARAPSLRSRCSSL